MKQTVLVFILVILLCVSSFGKEKNETHPTLNITTCNWQPYAGINLYKLGFASDLVTVILQRMGYETHIDILPWKRALILTKAGKYDMAYNAYYSPERARDFSLTDPYIRSQVYLCSRKNANISFTTLKELKPYRIGTVMGYVNPTELNAADYLTRDEVVNDLQNLKKLISKRVDLIVIDKYVAVYDIKTSPFLISNLADIVFHEPPLTTLPVHAMFSKAVPGYKVKVEGFNRVLADLIKDGTYDTLLELHNFK